MKRGIMPLKDGSWKFAVKKLAVGSWQLAVKSQNKTVGNQEVFLPTDNYIFPAYCQLTTANFLFLPTAN